MPLFVFRGLTVWLLMALVAVLNGMARDFLLAGLLGDRIALPLSGISLSLLIFAISWLTLPWFGSVGSRDCLRLGVMWVLATLAFEYLMGYFVAGRSLEEINRVFDLSGGNLFILVLLVTLVSPWLVWCLRGRTP